jgi:ATP-dependent RNA helicase RhlE
VRVLVATDIVARGIDVPGISHIVNYDLPDEPENYVHRIGRTGRNGAEGIAVTLCAPDEVKKLRAVEKVTRLALLPQSIRGEEPAPKPQRGRGPKPGARQGAPKAAQEPASGRFAKPAHKPAQKPAGAAASPAAAERAARRRPRRTQRAA